MSSMVYVKYYYMTKTDLKPRHRPATPNASDFICLKYNILSATNAANLSFLAHVKYFFGLVHI